MEKQIEEMANDLLESVEWKELIDDAVALDIDAMAENMRSKDYRKVIVCKDCKYFFNEYIKACTYWNGHATTETNYCSCAKMRGE